MRARIALTSFIEELLYQVVLKNRYLSDHAELPDAQYRAIRFIGREGEVSMRHIAEFLGVSMPRATSVIDTLEAQELAERTHGADRRMVQVRLTLKGRQVVEEAHEAHEKLAETILSPLNQQERDEMYRLLSKCTRDLG